MPETLHFGRFFGFGGILVEFFVFSGLHVRCFGFGGRLVMFFEELLYCLWVAYWLDQQYCGKLLVASQ